MQTLAPYITINNRKTELNETTFEPGCSFIVANARVVDFPIVHASETFMQMSGFAQTELLQRSCLCPMMHGELTNSATVDRLRAALSTQIEDHVEMLLYKKTSE